MLMEFTHDFSKQIPKFSPRLRSHSLGSSKGKKKNISNVFCWINNKLAKVLCTVLAFQMTFSGFKYGFNAIIGMLLNNQFTMHQQICPLKYNSLYKLISCFLYPNEFNI